MDFYDLLKEAARNKKKAESELQENKRFSLNFRPKKLPPKPKVDRAAIAARLKKKEKEEKRQAAIDEKKKQEVLALRAEQEIAKAAARKRKFSSSSSHQPSTSTKEKSKEQRKKPPKEESESDSDEERRPKEEKPSRAKREKAVAPKKEKYEDYLFKKRHEEEEAKARNAKAMQDTKPKPFSFKELMNIAAANAGIAKPETADQNIHDKKCQPNVKLKNGHSAAPEKRRSENRIPHARDRESASSDERRKEVHRRMDRKDKSANERRKEVDRRMDNKDKSAYKKPALAKETTSKRHELPSSDQKKKSDSRYNGHNPKDNVQVDRKATTKNHSIPRPPKSTCFPNTKALDDQTENSPKAKLPHDRERSESKKKQVTAVTSGSHQNNPKKASDGELRHKERAKIEKRDAGRGVENERPSHHPVKRKGDWLDSDKEPKRQPGAVTERMNGKPSQHPVKRKGGWLDPVGEPARNPTGPGERKNVNAAHHHPVKRKEGRLDLAKSPAQDRDMDRQVNGNTKKVIKSSKDRTVLNGAEKDRPKPKEGGWLDSVERGPMEVDKKVLPNKEKKKDIRASSSSPVTKARPESSKVSRVEAPVKPKKRGWLTAEVEPPAPKRPGGWLGAAREPAHSRPGAWLGPAREPAWQAKGGRLLSSDEEEEDSDLDGFIDDEPLGDEPANVSSYIKEIFGYDKSSFNDESLLSDYALRNSMQSSYSQMMKEEAKSARIGAREDAEELMKEKEREKKKLAAKSKRR